jgi:predicted GIY-YIG superfamily endonuclease
MKHSLYTLSFDAPEGTIVFYVGCTNNPTRREREHKTNPFNENHAEYQTYKYQFCRKLALKENAYKLDVIIDDIGTDEDSEYEWVLNFARHNTAQGFEFINGYPLTNMKAGDFLSEIINRPEIRSAADIKKYKSDRIAAANAISYNRRYDKETAGPVNPGWTELKEKMAVESAAYIEQCELKSRKKAAAKAREIEMLSSEDRMARLKAEAERLERRIS